MDALWVFLLGRNWQKMEPVGKYGYVIKKFRGALTRDFPGSLMSLIHFIPHMLISTSYRIESD